MRAGQEWTYTLKVTRTKHSLNWFRSCRHLIRPIQCAHKYTGRPICATPCDGLDDLCLDNADEQCAEEARPFVLVPGIVLALSIVAVAIVNGFDFLRSLIKERSPHVDEEEEELRHLSRPKSLIASPDPVKFFGDESASDSEQLGKRLACFLSFSSHMRGLNDVRERSIELHQHLQTSKADQQADVEFLETIGSCSEAMLFNDALENGVVFRAKIRLANVLGSRVQDALCSAAWHKLSAIAATVMLVFLHYFDLVKDVLVAYHITEKMSSAFNANAFALLTTMALSAPILVTELLNCVAFLRSDYGSGLPKAKRALGALLTPFLPVFLACELCNLNLKSKLCHHEIASCMDNGDSSALVANLETDLIEISSSIDPIYCLLKNFKANEVVAESIFQTVAILVVVLVDRSGTSRVANLGGILLNSEFALVIAALAASFISLILGHTLYMKKCKRGFLPIKAVLFLLAYFAVGILARVWTLVVFLTPQLGILDTMAHAKFGQLSGGKTKVGRGLISVDLYL